MKLSKTTVLVITAGIFIIALAGLGMVWFRQTQEQNQLSEQLASVQSRLSTVQLEQLVSRQSELSKQLNRVR